MGMRLKKKKKNSSWQNVALPRHPEKIGFHQNRQIGSDPAENWIYCGDLLQDQSNIFFILSIARWVTKFMSRSCECRAMGTCIYGRLFFSPAASLPREYKTPSFAPFSFFPHLSKSN